MAERKKTLPEATPTTLRFWTITEAYSMSPRNDAPVHPGEILLEEFLVPMGISQYRLAKDISVSPRRINEVVRGQRSITADTALRLARYFRTTERFWMNLQTRYECRNPKSE
jgi:addiction module HigA family antidote